MNRFENFTVNERGILIDNDSIPVSPEEEEQFYMLHTFIRMMVGNFAFTTRQNTHNDTTLNSALAISFNTPIPEQVVEPVPIVTLTNEDSILEKIILSDECVICMTNYPSIMMYDCGHTCICDECSHDKAMEKITKCPICRTKLTKILRLE